MLKKVKSENLNFTKIAKFGQTLCFATGLLYCNVSYGTTEATGDTELDVVAKVQPSAVVTIGANNLDFGDYAGSAKSISTTITIAATDGTDYDVGLSLGLHSDSGQRRMEGVSDNTKHLKYNLYQDAGESIEWGDTANSNRKNFLDPASDDVIIYAKVLDAQSVPVDTYEDTVLVNVYFNNAQ